MGLVFDGRFAGGKDFSAYGRMDLDPGGGGLPPIAGGVAGSYELVKDPVGSGALVAKLTIPSDSPGRCELRPIVAEFPGGGPVWGERWYFWETYVAPSFSALGSSGSDASSNLFSSTWVIIGQMHDTADGGDTVHIPPWALHIEGDRYKLVTTWDTDDPTVSRVPNLRVLSDWPLDRGRWIPWVVHVKIAANTDGFLHFYKDHRLQYSVTGTPTSYNDAVGTFSKFGAYGYGTPCSVYSKGVVIGDEESNYLEVTGHAALERDVIRTLR